MDIGFFLSGLLTGLREGVEAALIVSIILAYLAKTGNARHFSTIWLGAGAAIAVSVVVGLVLFVTIGGFEEPDEQIFEGFAMILAAGVVTWMLFWMRRTGGERQGRAARGVDRALVEGGVLGPRVLAFTAVIREGIETALFLIGQATAAGRRGAQHAARRAGRPRDRRRHRLRDLPRRARHQPAHLLPVDRHRPDLHRRRASCATAFTSSSRPAASPSAPAPRSTSAASCPTSRTRGRSAWWARSCGRCSATRATPGVDHADRLAHLRGGRPVPLPAAGSTGRRQGDDAGAATGRRLIPPVTRGRRPSPPAVGVVVIPRAPRRP